jgi:hypothetical protein
MSYHHRSHYGLALAGLLALIAFAFGKKTAVNCVRVIFALAFLFALVISFDIATAFWR